jgi:hypothetical protein
MKAPRNNTSPLTPARLRELLSFDPNEGIFRWAATAPRGRGHPRPGKVAGGLNAEGYVKIMLDGTRYAAHRLAWFWVHGEWPSSWLDHEKGARSDNRAAKLRPADGSTNAANSCGWKRSGAGLKGCYPQNGGSTWQAAIRVNRKLIYLGSFPTEQLAHEAYVAAARQHFGEFANAGNAAAK